MFLTFKSSVNCLHKITEHHQLLSARGMSAKMAANGISFLQQSIFTINQQSVPDLPYDTFGKYQGSRAWVTSNIKINEGRFCLEVLDFRQKLNILREDRKVLRAPSFGNPALPILCYSDYKQFKT